MSQRDLEAGLDELRLAGLLQLTDWVQGRGQGYVLTPAGAQALQDPRHLELLRNGALEFEEQGEAQARQESPRVRAIREATRRPVTPVITVGLILLNVLWFLAGAVQASQQNIPLNTFLWSPPIESLVESGALSGHFIVQGQWWRLLTCCFVHIGLLHLGMNMWSLYILGRIQEGLWGHLRFLAIYMIAGFGGSCVMVIAKPADVGAGASGAIFGLMASLAVWLVLNRRYLSEGATVLLRRLMWVFLLNVFISTLPHVSAAAHFGGTATGLVAALLLHEARFRRGILGWLCLAGVIALPVLCLVAVDKAQKMDERWEPIDLEYRSKEVGNVALRQVREIEETKIQPFFKNRLKARSLEETQEALAASQQICTYISQARELLQGTGPYRNQQTEQKRQEEIDNLADMRRRNELREIELIAPLEADARRQSIVAWNKAGKQLHHPATVRNAEDVNEALVTLTEAQAQLNSVTDLLKDLAPFQNVEAEQKRNDLREVLLAQGQMLRLASDRLKKGIAWTKEDEKAFDQQLKPLMERLHLKIGNRG